MPDLRQDPSDQPLKDDTLVVRGGLMELNGLRNSVQTGYVRDGYYSLSFFGADGVTVEEIIAAAKANYPGSLNNKKIRLSTAGEIEAKIGRKPHREGDFPHLEVRFETNPSDEDLQAIEEVFDAPVDNPLPGG